MTAKLLVTALVSVRCSSQAMLQVDYIFRMFYMPTSLKMYVAKMLLHWNSLYFFFTLAVFYDLHYTCLFVKHTRTHIYIHTYTHTHACMHAYIHTYIQGCLGGRMVSVAD